MSNSENETRDYIKYKNVWNKAIERKFKYFLEFFALDLFEKMDLSKGFEFLDFELESLFYKSEKSKENIDKLVKVYLKDGTEKWLLCVVEVEGYDKGDFEKRMFKYYYRILDKYDKDIFIISVLSHKYENDLLDNYNYKFLDTQLNFRYRVYNILDQEQEKLKESDNYFANLVLNVL
jgi:hypothetical protein